MKREHSTWHEQLVEHAPDALLLVDSDGTIRLANHQAETLFGYSRVELVGANVDTLVPESARDHHHRHRDGFFKNPKVRSMGAGFDLEGVKKNGHAFPVEISLSPVKTDEGKLVVAAVRDATNRQKAQNQLRALLETAPDAMVIINEKGLITLVNQQAESMFDFNRKQMIGQPIEILIPDHLKHRHQDHRAGYFKRPKRREMGIGLELSGKRRNGTTFPVEISLGHLNTETGRWATAAIRDLSERKRMEQLEISHREMEQFSYAASHDLKAPLRNIVSLTDVLQEDLSELGLPSHISDTLELISVNTSRMHSLVQDLLEFSRIDTHDQHFKPSDLNVVVANICQMIDADLTSSGADIRYHSLPTTTLDPALIQQLLQNLVTNAIKFQPKGQRPIIEIQAAERDEGWEITVSDNGIGIAPEYRENVFQVFSRLHDLQEYEGNGIGLAICKKIVDIHHGRIWVEANEPNGSSIHFTIAHRVEAE